MKITIIVDTEILKILKNDQVKLIAYFSEKIADGMQKTEKKREYYKNWLKKTK